MDSRLRPTHHTHHHMPHGPAQRPIPQDHPTRPDRYLGPAASGSREGTVSDARELARRIALARSILNQRRWAGQDEQHVREVLAALDGCGIAEILRRAG